MTDMISVIRRSRLTRVFDVVNESSIRWVVGTAFALLISLLLSGQGCPFSSALYVTIRDKATDELLTDAVVTLESGDYPPASETEGVYAFPLLVPGTYEVLAEAPDYEALTFTVEIEAGEQKWFVVELARLGEGAGSVDETSEDGASTDRVLSCGRRIFADEGI